MPKAGPLEPVRLGRRKTRGTYPSRWDVAGNLCFQITHVARLPCPEVEYRFHVERKWRFDLAWPNNKRAIEIEGHGPRTRGAIGRHQSARGFAQDLEKYNEAALAGWTVLRFTTRDVANGTALQMIERLWKGADQ